MTIDIQQQIDLNCVDIKKDSEGADPNEIYESRDDVITGKCKDSPNLSIVKDAITNSYEKLFPIINNGNKNSKINVNIKNFFIDAGWSKNIMDRYLDFDSTLKSINICQTPATYSDPGPKPFADRSVDIDYTFNLGTIGLNAVVTYKSSGLLTLNKSTSKINIIIVPGSKPNKFNKIDCYLNYKRDIVAFNSGSNKLSKLFKGNNEKKNYINFNKNKNNDNYKKNRNAYVICKELGDTMQAYCLKYILDNNQTEGNNDYKKYKASNCALLTNDAVLAARSLTFGIPFIVLNAKAGLVKYYCPGKIESVNASFFETYISNALQYNNDQLNLLNEWRTKYLNQKIIKIKGSDDTYCFNEKLNSLFDEFVTCINNCNEILNILNSNFKKIDFSYDKNLQKFKIFTSLLTVQKMIFKVNSKFIINNKFKEFLNKSLLNILKSDNKIKIFNNISKERTSFFTLIKETILDYIYGISNETLPLPSENTFSIVNLNDFIIDLINDNNLALDFYNKLDELKISEGITLSEFIIKYCKEKKKTSGGKKIKSLKKYKKYNKKSKKHKKSKQNKKKYKFIKKSKKKSKKKYKKKGGAGTKRNRNNQYDTSDYPQKRNRNDQYNTSYEYNIDVDMSDSPEEGSSQSLPVPISQQSQPQYQQAFTSFLDRSPLIIPDDLNIPDQQEPQQQSQQPQQQPQQPQQQLQEESEQEESEQEEYPEEFDEYDESTHYYQDTEFTHFMDDEDVLSIYSIIYPFIYINPYIYYYLIKYEDQFKKFVEKILKDEDLKFIYDLIIQNNINDSVIEITDDTNDNILTNKYNNHENIDQLLTYEFQLKIYELLNK